MLANLLTLTLLLCFTVNSDHCKQWCHPSHLMIRLTHDEISWVNGGIGSQPRTEVVSWLVNIGLSNLWIRFSQQKVQAHKLYILRVFFFCVASFTSSSVGHRYDLFLQVGGFPSQVAKRIYFHCPHVLHEFFLRNDINFFYFSVPRPGLSRQLLNNFCYIFWVDDWVLRNIVILLCESDVAAFLRRKWNL